MSTGSFDWSFKAQGSREAGVLLGILEKLDDMLGVLSRQEQQTAQTFGQLGTIFAKLESGINTLASSFEKYQHAASNAGNVNQQFQQKIDNSIQKNSTFNNTIDQSTNTVNQYSNQVDNSTNIINRYGAATQQTGSRVGGLGKALTHAAGVWNTWNKAVDFAAKRFHQFVGLITGWEKNLRDIGGQFERSEATMRVLADGAGSSSEEIDALVTKVKQLGRETEFTAGEAADGAITLIKAGNDASGATDKLEASLDAALATGLNFGKTAKIGTAAWNIFGKNLGKTGDETKNYATALKVMIASANSADVEVTDLYSSIVRGGSILADLGVSLTRTTTALGLLGNNGIKGGRAMTLLSISVKRLVDGTIPAKKALQELGVTATDEQGNLKDLGALMQELGDKLNLRRPNEQVKLMKDLFGAGDKVMRTLLNAGVEGFDKLENSIEGALGTMGKLKDAKMDTIVGAWKSFQSAVESVWVELVAVLRVPVMEYWNALTMVLRKVSERISDIGKRFQENGSTLEDWIKLVKSGGVKGIFEGLPEELKDEIETLKTLWGAFSEFIIALLREKIVANVEKIWDAFFTDDVTAKASELGGKVGSAIIAGITSTTPGKIIGASIAANMLFSVKGAITKITGMVGGIAPMISKAAALLPGAGAAAAAVPGAAGAGAGMVSALAAPVAIGVGVGVAANYGIKKIAEHYDAKAAQEEERSVRVLTIHLQKMVHLKESLSQIPIAERTEEESAKIERINKQIAQTGNELKKLGAMGPEGDFLANYFADQVEKSKRELDDLAKAQKEAADAAAEKAPEPIDWGKQYEYHRFKKETGSKETIENYQQSADYETWNAAKQAKQGETAWKKQEADRQAQIDAVAKREGVGQDEAERLLRIDEAMKKAKDSEKRAGETGTEDLKSLSDDELNAKQEMLNNQQQLNDEEEKYKEHLERAKNVILEMNVALNDISSNFEQWLLNPVDVFQQKLLGVKETFGGLMDGLKNKKVDLAEKFGLQSTEQAGKERTRIAEAGLQRDARLLELAQTPEERMKIQERMAEKAAGLAEMSEGPGQQQYAQKAQNFLDKAAAAAADAEELEINRLEIQKEYAKKNLSEYEAMVNNAETSGGKAAALELAQQAYMQLGPEYAEKAQRATEELKVAKAEAATEEAERFKTMAENSSIQVELLSRLVEKAEQQLNESRTQQQIPQNPEYADDTWG